MWQRYSNGHRLRTLTRGGQVVLAMPRTRDGSFSADLFFRYRRSEQALGPALTYLSASDGHRLELHSRRPDRDLHQPRSVGPQSKHHDLAESAQGKRKGGRKATGLPETAGLPKMQKISCTACQPNGSRLFTYLIYDERTRLSQLIRHRSYVQGEVIVSQGDTTYGCYILCRGIVELASRKGLQRSY